MGSNIVEILFKIPFFDTNVFVAIKRISGSLILTLHTLLYDLNVWFFSPAQQLQISISDRGTKEPC